MTGVCLLKTVLFAHALIAPRCLWANVASVLSHFCTEIKPFLLLFSLPLTLQQAHAERSSRGEQPLALRGFVPVRMSPPPPHPRGGGRVWGEGLKNSDACELGEEYGRKRLMRCSRSVTCPPGAISLHPLGW